MIEFPAIDPIIFQLGPFAVRWYSLSYFLGFIIAARYMFRLTAYKGAPLNRQHFESLLFILPLSVIVGGRLGYVLFYNIDYYLDSPLRILFLWQGGMSFHGGFIAVIVACILFFWQKKLPFLFFFDQLAQIVPVTLGLGRIANFINGELWGRVTDMPWGMVFPHVDAAARHPSQLYQAFLEGVCLFFLIFFVRKYHSFQAKKADGEVPGPGYVAGIFCLGYGCMRLVAELFREPDQHIGFLFGGVSMGQMLSLPMILLGVTLIGLGYRSKQKLALSHCFPR